ncbi:MAG: LCP family protein [Bacillota bacterium]
MQRLRWKLDRKKTIIIGFVTAVLLITTYFVGFKIIGKSNKLSPVAVSKQLAETGRVNILLLGTDARPDEEAARSDTMILLTLDGATKKISMLSVPRDSRVEIPGHGKDKINAALGIGGPDLAVQVVSTLLNQKIDYYVLTRLDGFKDIIDTLGGITIDVEKNMHYIGRDAKGNVDVSINLTKGLQHLNGEKALEYVRFRHDALGDITRTQRQQKLLKAMAEESLQASTIIKLPVLIPELLKTVQTNLNFRDLLALLNLSKKLDKNNIVTLTLPGSFLNVNGASYWQVDSDLAKDVVNELAEGNAPTQVIQTTGGSDGEITQVVWKQKPQPEKEPTSVTGATYGDEQTVPTEPPVQPGTGDGSPPGTGTDTPGTGDTPPDQNNSPPGDGTIQPQPGQPGTGDNTGTGQPGSDTDTGQPDPGTGDGTVPPADPPPEQIPPGTQG